MWTIIQDKIPIGFFQHKIDAEEALTKYLDVGFIVERKASHN